MEIKSIHNQFHKMLLSYISTRVHNSDDAADILQEVYIKIVTKLDSLSEKTKLKNWIFVITRNAIIDYYRKGTNKKQVEITEKLVNEVIAVTEEDTTKGLETCLKRFIQKLPEDYRDIIIDSEIKGIKQKDLTEKYNLAYPSVRSKVQRGRSRLKNMLLDCCTIKADSRGNILDSNCKSDCDDDLNNC
jgi:RNA polymerase sigma-70 factor, ECF subfamily